ncbi:MAG: FtsX-like permease family protein, partial [bacterium]
DRPPSGTPVVVLGYSYWRLHYGGSNVLGKSLRIGDGVYTIIGVAPAGLVGITDTNAPAMFVPITSFAGLRGHGYVQNYNWTWMGMVVRRKPNVSIAAANADLSLAFARSWELARERSRAASPNAASAAKVRARAEAAPVLLARGPDADQNSHVATWVMGVALIVLLIACANVTNLLLAHAVKRRREIALRLALGVTRRRLFQQFLTESLLLAFLGGLAGLVVAQFGGRLVRRLFLSAEDASAVATDGRTLVFVALATLTVAILTGLAPAMHALRGDVADALKAGSRDGSYRRSRIRTALLLFQGAFSVVLLVGAGLFVRSLSNVRAMRLGYDVAPVAYAAGVKRGVKLEAAEMNALADRLIAAATAIPGVQSASLILSVPFWSSEGQGAPFVPGLDSVGKLGNFGIQAGSTSYFETVGTRILRGRGFLDGDRGNSAPIVVVNEAMANALWPGKDPLGQVMRIGSDTMPFKTVVGVAENMRAEEISGKPEFWYYVPMQQYAAEFGASFPELFVRVNGRAEERVETIRKTLQREMPGDAYVNVVPLGTLVAPRQRSWEFGAKMFVAFGGLALVLAAIGLYSVVAYGVAQRTHEIGIRIALGAGLGDVMRMIVLQGLSFAIAGIAIGSVIAVWAGRWVEPLLFSQKAFDPVIYASVAGMLLFVAVIATLQPALRASRVDPNVALRSD